MKIRTRAIPAAKELDYRLTDLQIVSDHYSVPMVTMSLSFPLDVMPDLYHVVSYSQAKKLLRDKMDITLK